MALSSIVVSIDGNARGLIKQAALAETALKNLGMQIRIANKESLVGVPAMNSYGEKLAKMQIAAKGVAHTLNDLTKGERIMATAWGRNANLVDKKYLHSIRGLKDAYAGLSREFANSYVITKGGVKTFEDASMGLTRFVAKANLAARTGSNIGTSIINAGKNAQWTGRQLMVGVTAPIALLGAGAVKSALDVEKLDIQLQKVMGSASSGDLAMLDKQTRDIAASFGIARTELKGVQTEFARVGMSADEVAAATKRTEELSMVGDIDTGDAQQLIQVMAQMGYSWDKIDDQLQKFNVIDDQTNLSLKETVASLKDVLPTANKFNMSAAETAALMTGITQGGFSSSEAGIALNNALGKLPAALANLQSGDSGGRARLKDLQEQLEALEQQAGMPLELVDPETGEIKNGTEMLVNFAGAIKKVHDEGGDEGKAKFIQAMRAMFVQSGLPEGMQLMESLSVAMDGVNDSTNDLGKAMSIAKGEAGSFSDEWKRQLDVVQNSNPAIIAAQMERIKIVFADVGAEILPTIADLAEKFAGFVEAFSNLGEGPKKAILLFAGALAILGPIIYAIGQGTLVFGTAVKGLFAPLKKIFSMKFKDVRTAEQARAIDSIAVSLETLRQMEENGMVTDKEAADLRKRLFDEAHLDVSTFIEAKREQLVAVEQANDGIVASERDVATAVGNSANSQKGAAKQDYSHLPPPPLGPMHGPAFGSSLPQRVPGGSHIPGSMPDEVDAYGGFAFQDNKGLMKSIRQRVKENLAKQQVEDSATVQAMRADIDAFRSGQEGKIFNIIEYTKTPDIDAMGPLLKAKGELEAQIASLGGQNPQEQALLAETMALAAVGPEPDYPSAEVNAKKAIARKAENQAKKFEQTFGRVMPAANAEITMGMTAAIDRVMGGVKAGGGNAKGLAEHLKATASGRGRGAHDSFVARILEEATVGQHLADAGVPQAKIDAFVKKMYGDPAKIAKDIERLKDASEAAGNGRKVSAQQVMEVIERHKVSSDEINRQMASKFNVSPIQSLDMRGEKEDPLLKAVRTRKQQLQKSENALTGEVAQVSAIQAGIDGEIRKILAGHAGDKQAYMNNLVNEHKSALVAVQEGSEAAIADLFEISQKINMLEAESQETYFRIQKAGDPSGPTIVSSLEEWEAKVTAEASKVDPAKIKEAATAEFKRVKQGMDEAAALMTPEGLGMARAAAAKAKAGEKGLAGAIKEDARWDVVPRTLREIEEENARKAKEEAQRIKIAIVEQKVALEAPYREQTLRGMHVGGKGFGPINLGRKIRPAPLSDQEHDAIEQYYNEKGADAPRLDRMELGEEIGVSREETARMLGKQQVKAEAKRAKQAAKAARKDAGRAARSSAREGGAGRLSSFFQGRAAKKGLGDGAKSVSRLGRALSKVGANGPKLGSVASSLSSMTMMVPGLEGLSSGLMNMSMASGSLTTILGGSGGAGGILAPLGGALPILIPIIAAVVLLVVTFNKWKDTAQHGLDKLKSAFGGLKDAILGPFMDLFAMISENGQGTFDKLGKIIGWFADVLATVIRFITPVFAVVSKVIAGIIGIWLKIFGLFIDIFTGSWSDAGDMVGDILQMILNIWKVVAGNIVLVSLAVVQSIVSAFGDMIGWITTAFGKLVANIAGLGRHLPIVGDSIGKWADDFREKSQGVADSMHSWGEGLFSGMKEDAEAWANTDIIPKRAKGKAKKEGKKVGEEAGSAFGSGIESGIPDGPLSGPIGDDKGDTVDAAREAGDDAADAFLGEFQNQLRGVVDGWKEAALAAFDEYAEMRIKAIDDQVEAIDKLVEAEEKAQEDLDYLQKKEDLRVKRSTEALKFSNDKDLAIYEGRYDDAKNLQLDYLDSQFSQAKDEAQLEKDRQKQLTDRAREGQKKRLADLKDSTKKQLDEKKRQLQKELDAMTEYLPRNAYAAAALQNAILNTMRKYTTSYWNIGKEHQDQWAAGWSTAIQKTYAKLADDAYWKGRAAAGRYAAGMQSVTASPKIGYPDAYGVGQRDGKKYQDGFSEAMKRGATALLSKQDDSGQWRSMTLQELNMIMAGKNRFGNVFSYAKGGVPGKIGKGNRVLYQWNEPGTGGEAFIPKNIPFDRAKSLLDIAAGWHGLQVIPQEAASRIAAYSSSSSRRMGLSSSLASSGAANVSTGDTIVNVSVSGPFYGTEREAERFGKMIETKVKPKLDRVSGAQSRKFSKVTK